MGFLEGMNLCLLVTSLRFFERTLGEMDAGIHPGYLERMLQPHLSAVCEDKFNLFQKSSPRQPFLFVSLGGGEKNWKNSSKLRFDQLAEERLSLKDMKGLIILILFLLKFIITSSPPPTCPGRTKGGNINIQKPPSIWLIKNSFGWRPEERKWLRGWRW